jgi:hypothetical protein
MLIELYRHADSVCRFDVVRVLVLNTLPAWHATSQYRTFMQPRHVRLAPPAPHLEHVRITFR